LWQYGKNRHITPNISECSAPTLIYFTGLVGTRHICGDDFPNIRLAVAQETLLWQPVKYGRCLQTSHGTNLLFASAFDNGLADRKSAFKRFNGSNQATSCPNLVNFHPVISEFTLLKRAIFAVICPQFDDDLHSSCWRFQTDWKITI